MCISATDSPINILLAVRQKWTESALQNMVAGDARGVIPWRGNRPFMLVKLMGFQQTPPVARWRFAMYPSLLVTSLCLLFPLVLFWYNGRLSLLL